jgi:uridine phosphorylase
VEIGDIVVPTGAIVDEGTSRHYAQPRETVEESFQGPDDPTTAPSASITNIIQAALKDSGKTFHTGAVWSTDAIYRETFEKRDYYFRKGALAVEMEASALFSVAGFRGVDIGAILVVSDELSGTDWKPGFRDERFGLGRKDACQVMEMLSKELM